MTTAQIDTRTLLLARPRGYCAGVERAVDTVERLLEQHGPPVYVRKQIVHNIHVVRRLEERGAVFVESEQDVPEGAICVLSAHGVAPEVYRTAAARGLQTVDATCPLVTKVHKEARRFAEDGYTIFLVGHADHEEVVGTKGEAPQAITLVECVDDVDGLDPVDPERVAYVTQTTLSVDETNAVVERLRERFPSIVGPPKDDICYATTNRQGAVKSLARHVDLVLVIGSSNSSNSQRLVDVTRDQGVPAYLIDDESHIRPEWLAGAATVGITSGASAPEWLVERVVAWFRDRGVAEVAEHDVIEEDVHFALPREVRRPLATGPLS
jgi:4-hydroxy-3-methylbut-2-enyl diphosphate reductase